MLKVATDHGVSMADMRGPTRRWIVGNARKKFAKTLFAEQKWHPDAIAKFLCKHRTTVLYMLGLAGSSRHPRDYDSLADESFFAQKDVYPPLPPITGNESPDLWV